MNVKGIKKKYSKTNITPFIEEIQLSDGGSPIFIFKLREFIKRKYRNNVIKKNMLKIDPTDNLYNIAEELEWEVKHMFLSANVERWPFDKNLEMALIEKISSGSKLEYTVLKSKDDVIVVNTPECFWDIFNFDKSDTQGEQKC